VQVALDATPLLGRPTGVGAFCAGALGGLAGRDDVDVAAFAVSWRRRRELTGALPPGVRRVGRPMPARPLHLAWRSAGVPPVEWFTGPLDVVHGTNFVVPPARRAARVVTVHDLTVVRFPELCDPPTLRYPRLLRRAIAEGAWVHTPSAYVADEVVELLGARRERVRAVHSGIPAAPASRGSSGAEGGGEGPGPAPLALPASTSRYVLALGTAEPRKDLPGLVAAFDAVASSPDAADVALVLAGPDGWGAGALDAAVAGAAHRDRIVRTGWVPETTRPLLVAGAAVLAYPSRYEGFGFPPLEAMAAGVPVVATRAGALPEVLGDDALLVDVGDHDALAGALLEVLRAPDVGAAWAERGRARAARYSWDRCAEGLAALYRDAHGERPS
jgi:glycosyltransferase involved in cell wall biosynthesis